MKEVPFLPLPIKQATRWSKPFKPIANGILRVYPSIKTKLKQAAVPISAIDYLTLTIFSTIFMGLVAFIPLITIGMVTTNTANAISISVLASLLIALPVFSYSLAYPNFLIRKKVRLLERDLLYALKFMLIRIRSGVPLYDAMVGIAHGDFGEVSNEFKQVVKAIATGKEDVAALEDMALRNPSPFVRRTVWQIANNLRAGVDIGSTLSSLIETLVKEQKILIRKYGSELNPVILMYLMLAIVIPSLGITILVVMSAFSGIDLPVYLFYMIPIAVLILQIFFTKLIKDKKPMINM